MRVAAALVTFFVVASLAGSPVQAAGSGTIAKDDSTGLIGVGVSSQPVVGRGRKNLCTWSWLTKGQVLGIANQSSELSAEDLKAGATALVGGIEHHVYSFKCPGDSGLRLINPNRDPESFAAAIRDYADGIIELPVPDVNPPIDGGGYVNLGMWLAVQPAKYEPITASAGPVWMTVTPTPGMTTFTFGTGDEPEVCDAFGVPIVDLDVIEEGPCGYTYRQPGTYTVTAVTTWLLPYTSSSGSGALDPMERTTTFEYRVREIQTVGVATDG